jgi:hypothetical protein
VRTNLSPCANFQKRVAIAPCRLGGRASEPVWHESFCLLPFVVIPNERSEEESLFALQIPHRHHSSAMVKLCNSMSRNSRKRRRARLQEAAERKKAAVLQASVRQGSPEAPAQVTTDRDTFFLNVTAQNSAKPAKPTSFQRVKRNKLVAILVPAAVIVAALVSFLGNVAGIGDFTGKVFAYFSEPLKIDVDRGVIIEPWYHLITPIPPAPIKSQSPCGFASVPQLRPAGICGFLDILCRLGLNMVG